MNPKDQNYVVLNDGVSSTSQNLSKTGKVFDAQQRSTQPQQHKKQVRRRLHTTKPYQERLLNMAEARREIVTALKFHRASMKEASEQKKQQQQQEAQEQIQRQSLSPQPSQYQSFEQDGRYKSRRNPRIYPSCKTNSPSVSTSYTWSAASSMAPPPLLAENLNFILPNQTLGLNLNFHDFNNLEFTVHLNNNSSVSSSYSSSSTSSQEVPSVGTSQVEGFLVDTIDSNAATRVNEGLHTVMNDGAPKTKGENDAYCDFDQHLEFPTWLNANERCLEQCSEDCFQDSTLPCMDIGDIDTVDDDWLT